MTENREFFARYQEQSAIDLSNYIRACARQVRIWRGLAATETGAERAQSLKSARYYEDQLRIIAG